jgi:hypothetical protein
MPAPLKACDKENRVIFRLISGGTLKAGGVLGASVEVGSKGFARFVAWINVLSRFGSRSPLGSLARSPKANQRQTPRQIGPAPLLLSEDRELAVIAAE